MLGMNAREFAFAKQAQALGMVRVRRILKLVAMVNETPTQRVVRLLPCNNRGPKINPMSVRQRVFQTARLLMELERGPIAVSKLKAEIHKRTGIDPKKIQETLCNFPHAIKNGGYWSLAV